MLSHYFDKNSVKATFYQIGTKIGIPTIIALEFLFVHYYEMNILDLYH